MAFRRFKPLSAEDSFETRSRLQGLAVMVGFCLMFATGMYLLWDMPPGTKGAYIWYQYAASLAIGLPGVVLIGYWVIKKSAKLIRLRPRLLLSNDGIHGLDISRKPSRWRDVEEIAAFSNRPKSVTRPRRRDTPEAIDGDAILVLRLSDAAWKSGNIGKHQHRMRSSHAKTYGLDGISIDPGRYGKDARKLLKEIETLKARLG